jgi:hypothetical protein
MLAYIGVGLSRKIRFPIGLPRGGPAWGAARGGGAALRCRLRAWARTVGQGSRYDRPFTNRYGGCDDGDRLCRCGGGEPVHAVGCRPVPAGPFRVSQGGRGRAGRGEVPAVRPGRAARVPGGDGFARGGAGGGAGGVARGASGALPRGRRLAAGGGRCDPRARIFGRHAAVPVERVRELGFDALLAATRAPVLDAKLLGMPRREAAVVSFERLEAVWGPMTAVSAVSFTPELLGAVVPMTGGSSGIDPEVPFPGYYRKLEFSVRQLKCFDETNPESFGDDEIGIGGTAVHTDGTVTQVGRKTYDDFSDGDSAWLNWTFASFTRTKPKSGGIVYDTYGVFIALAEVDSGGFQKALDKIYAQVQDKVKAAIATAVTAGASPFVGPFLGAVAGAVAAWVADKLIEWVISWFGDDLFPVKYATLTGPRGFAFLPVRQVDPRGHGVSQQGRVAEVLRPRRTLRRALLLARERLGERQRATVTSAQSPAPDRDLRRSHSARLTAFASFPATVFM